MNRNVRRGRKRITGRFYLILAAVAILAIGGVLIARGVSNWNDSRRAPDIQNASQTGDCQPEGQETLIDDQGTEDGQAEQGQVASLDELLNSDDAEGERTADLPELKPEDEVRVAENELSITEGLPKEWTNFLLLGDDARPKEKRGHTDTIIIASVNSTTGQVKLTSIMRDSMIEVPGRGLTRINNAYYFGGPNLVMKLLNEKLKLNIQGYVVANFYDFPVMIDALGGITMDIYPEEVTHINKNIRNAIKIMNEGKMKNVPTLRQHRLRESGADITLDGMQALAYARIRKLDNDYQRNLRQRKVITAALQKLRDTTNDPIKLMTLGVQLIGDINTNMANQLQVLVPMVSTVLSHGVGNVEDTHIPVSNSFADERRNNVYALYDIDWGKNTRELHKFIYGDDAVY